MGRRGEAVRPYCRIGAPLVLAGVLVTGATEAGQSLPADGAGSAVPAAAPLVLPFAIDGPPPPVPPAVIARDESGRATVRAVRVDTPIRLDGALDEAVYITVPSITGFIQIEPAEGAPATDRTDAWILFDREHLYVTFRCWEDRPDRIVANEMRRDSPNIFQNDYISIFLDTFYDRRNAFNFTVTPIGGRVDAQITNERQANDDWNTVWDFAVGRFAGGWTVEVAIPFKSLRYRPGRAQIWGINLDRRSAFKNELAFLTPIPQAFGSARAFMQMSYAATLVGLEVPAGSKNLELKPYVVSDLSTDRTATPRVSNDVGADIGVDLKYGVTQNLTADLTYNTDFAQVEADEQQVNLTRFSLFFPEKREFFLENQGTFAFGGASSGMGANTSDTPILFYSRRIGLSGGLIVPIDAGGRLTGRVGRFNLGLLNIQTDEEPSAGQPATNFSVLRLKRDILRRSSVGVMYTGRSVAEHGGGRNDAYGVDATFTFWDNLQFATYWARTRTPGVTGDDTSHRVQMDYAGDRYGVQLERLVIGARFQPQMGFVRRADMRRQFGQLRFSPRPRQSRLVRKLFWIGSLDYIENGGGQLETREWTGEFAIDFHSSDRLSVTYGHTYEFLPQPFPIASGVTLPSGRYAFAAVRAAYNSAPRRRLAANIAVESGTFYSGRKTTVSASRGRVKLSPRFSVEPTVSVNWVDLPEGAFTTKLVGSRVTYTMTPRMFVSTLLQFNSGTNTVAANLRLRWEYRPGSELFVVYNEQRDTLGPRLAALSNRALILKINRLVRF